MPNKDAYKNPNYRFLTCLPSIQGTDEYEIGLVQWFGACTRARPMFLYRSCHSLLHIQTITQVNF